MANKLIRLIRTNSASRSRTGLGTGRAGFRHLRSLFFLLLLSSLFFSSPGWGEQVFPRENAIVRAVREVSPAVVNISTSKFVERGVNPFFPWENDDLFNRFFRDFFEPRRRQYVQKSLGSGVIIDSTHKYILTNHHVIVRASKIVITLANQKEFEARVVGTDPESDLAVLKIETDSAIPAITMGGSDDLMIGETVIAIGNPFGLSHTVTTGVISALNRSVRTQTGVYHNFIQIDASINPGNSGGPLLNINGELIGINTAIYSGAEGIGFAIPIDRAKGIVNDLINYGRVHTAWLGIMVQDIDENLVNYFHLPVDYGALITEIMAGSPCPLEVMKKVTDQMHAREITICYGLTECSPVTNQTATDDSLELRCGTVGRPLPYVEVKIIDPETGKMVPVGKPGELCARGYMVMRGYYNKPTETAEVIDEAGWLHTGDLAEMDENGYCKIVGRSKDMIIRGGENVYPREIEEFLYTNPKIKDVQIIGVPDRKYGEQVAAWIQLKEDQKATPEEIQDFCKEKIAHYKIPKYIKFVDDFPMTVTGKIQKFKMREITSKELGLEQERTEMKQTK